MKLYDIYLIRQAKYSEYILLIESGMFIETYGKDAIILNNIFHYKIVTNNNYIKVGFPRANIDKVVLILENHNINHLILDKDNSISSRKKFKNNKYSNYRSNINCILDRNNRINKIVTRLKEKITDNTIDDILSNIESTL